MCFCSFNNCNPAETTLLKYAAKTSNWYNISCLVFIVIIGILLSNYQCSSSSSLQAIMEENLGYVCLNTRPSHIHVEQFKPSPEKHTIIFLRLKNTKIPKLTLHCPNQAFNTKCIDCEYLTKCVQKLTIVYGVNSSYYKIINSFRHLTSIFNKSRTISRSQPRVSLVIKDKNIPPLYSPLLVQEKLSTSMNLQNACAVDNNETRLCQSSSVE